MDTTNRRQPPPLPRFTSRGMRPPLARPAKPTTAGGASGRTVAGREAQGRGLPQRPRKAAEGGAAAAARLKHAGRSGPSDRVRAAVAGRTPPFSVLDLDAALANADELVGRAAGTPVRLASKSLRIRELISRVAARPGFRGVLSYHLEEALWLVSTGVTDDALVAYPSVDPSALARWAVDPAARAAVTVTVDCPEHVELLGAAARAAGLDVPGRDTGDGTRRLRVCLDVDAGLRVGPVLIGARRSPVRTARQAAALARRICLQPGLKLVGVLAYEGQIAGTADTSAAVRAMKALSARDPALRRSRVVHAVGGVVRAAGGRVEFVNGGGTGSVETTAAESAVTEIGAGSGVIGPGLFDGYRSFRPRPAEWFVCPVVRRPARDIVTLAGGGRIASGSPGADRQPRVDWPSGLRTLPLEGAGEVQTPLTGPAAAGLRLGDGVWLRHAKAGEQAEWCDEVLVVSAGRVIDTWPTYRGEKRSFL